MQGGKRETGNGQERQEAWPRCAWTYAQITARGMHIVASVEWGTPGERAVHYIPVCCLVLHWRVCGWALGSLVPWPRRVTYC